MVQIPGFSIHRRDRLDGTHRGVIIDAAHQIDGIPLHTVRRTHLERHPVEALWLDFSLGLLHFTLGGVYRPPRPELGLQESDNLLFATIERLSNENSPLVVFGDFNLPTITWAESIITTGAVVERAFLEMYTRTNLVQKVTFPTRHRRQQTPSILDLILTNDADFIAAPISRWPLSCIDHDILHTHTQVDVLTPASQTRPCYHKSKYDVIRESLSQYHNNSIALLQAHIPLNRTLVNPDKTWFDHSIRKLARQKLRTWKRYKTTGFDCDYSSHRTITKSDASKVIKTSTGLLATDQASIAETFVDEFQKVYTLEPPLTPEQQLLPSDGPTAALEDTYFSIIEVGQTLCSLSLVACVTSGVLLEDWKEALVTPIFKKGDQTDPINYRPISLTSPVGKVMERIVVRQMLDFITERRAFSKAFDNRLIVNLQRLSIRGKLLAWIRSYLNGSVLGPLLFVLYTIDIGRDFTCRWNAYADDTMLFADPVLSHQQLQCWVLHISKKKNSPVTYFLGNTRIETTSSQLDLGVVITENLKRDQQVRVDARKANR
ncbi:uncharacterized protein LOC108742549 [Agrilus planipennis]|uniref:Uncharacterized protein LOC108742549 n=1 Tax=Agrilus planipennis TaxID=224129 RepID=A0A1W4XLN9_AGRPL|nr:uncharacterized protein LOC108742549 [Agrilus planipennis]